MDLCMSTQEPEVCSFLHHVRIYHCSLFNLCDSRGQPASLPLIKVPLLDLTKAQANFWPNLYLRFNRPHIVPLKILLHDSDLVCLETHALSRSTILKVFLIARAHFNKHLRILIHHQGVYLLMIFVGLLYTTLFSDPILQSERVNLDWIFHRHCFVRISTICFNHTWAILLTLDLLATI